jgi:hypothetical protein
MYILYKQNLLFLQVSTSPIINKTSYAIDEHIKYWIEIEFNSIMKWFDIQMVFTTNPTYIQLKKVFKKLIQCYIK